MSTNRDLAVPELGQPWTADVIAERIAGSGRPHTEGYPYACRPVTIAALCNARVNGMSWTAACRMVGIGRQTINHWRDNADQGLEPYATAIEAMGRADGQGEALMTAKIQELAERREDARTLLQLMDRQWPEGRQLEESRADRLAAHQAQPTVHPAIQAARERARQIEEGS